MTTTAYVALGSNLGDRRDHIERAIVAIGRIPGVAVGRRSSLYETAPVGGPAGQGAYLNAVLSIDTSLSPEELMRHLLAIEASLGRVRTVKDGPRTVDLDLLLLGSQIRQTPELMLPHPRLHERLFVLEPLCEIAPGVVHPLLGRTAAQLRADLLGIAPLGATPGRELTGLRALVTGSTSGIGKAIALSLASGGADVIIHGHRSATAAEAVASEARERGHQATVLLADLRSPAACDDLAERAWTTWAGLDILINNAGADTLTGSGGKLSFDEKLEQLLSIDLKATMRLARHLGRRMKERGAGTVINMGWDQAETGMEGDSGELFAAVKGAVMCFTRSLALSLAPEVRVHCIAPGWIRTAWGEGASQTWQDRVLGETPLRTWGTPDDVAATARWLVSPAAKYVDGQIVRVNGGAVR